MKQHSSLRCIRIMGLWSLVRYTLVPASIGSSHIAVEHMSQGACTREIWGHKWKGKHVVARCDNEAALAVLKSHYSKYQQMKLMLPCLFFVEAHSSFKNRYTYRQEMPRVHKYLCLAHNTLILVTAYLTVAHVYMLTCDDL